MDHERPEGAPIDEVREGVVPQEEDRQVLAVEDEGGVEAMLEDQLRDGEVGLINEDVEDDVDTSRIGTNVAGPNEVGIDIEDMGDVVSNEEALRLAEMRIESMDEAEAQRMQEQYERELEGARNEMAEMIAKTQLTVQELKEIRGQWEALSEEVDWDDVSGASGVVDQISQKHFGADSGTAWKVLADVNPATGFMDAAYRLGKAALSSGEEREQAIGEWYRRARKLNPLIAGGELLYHLGGMALGSQERSAQHKEDLKAMIKDISWLARMFGTDEDRKQALTEAKVGAVMVGDVLTAVGIASTAGIGGIAVESTKMAAAKTFVTGMEQGLAKLEQQAAERPGSVSTWDVLRESVQIGIEASGKTPQEVVRMTGAQFGEMSQRDDLDPQKRAMYEGIAKLIQDHPDVVLEQIGAIDSRVRQIEV